MNKKDSYALITGASSGIGLEFAKLFAKDHVNLILVARNENALQALKTELQEAHAIQVVVIAKDLSESDAAPSIYSMCEKEQLQVDYLINNAGFGYAGSFATQPYTNSAQMIRLNIEALTSLTQLFGSQMVSRKNGYVLNVASIAGFLSGPGMAVYFATKNYVVAFSEALQSEWKTQGVSVTTLCPGPTQSAFFDRADMHAMSMLKYFPIPSAQEVALFGYVAMKKRKGVVIHGFANKMQVFLNRFVPRKVATTITGLAMKK
jgi:short-subunit dehydrogenase